MTFKEKQLALLADLILEREEWRYCDWWARRLDEKIADMREAIYGSGAGDQAGRGTGVQDVPGSDA